MKMEKETLIDQLRRISKSFFDKKDYISAGQINRAIDVIEDVEKTNDIFLQHKNERLSKMAGDCDEMHCSKCDEITGHVKDKKINNPLELALTCSICGNQKS